MQHKEKINPAPTSCTVAHKEIALEENRGGGRESELVFLPLQIRDASERSGFLWAMELPSTSVQQLPDKPPQGCMGRTSLGQ